MKDIKEKITEIITGSKEYWQPYGPKDGFFIIEEEEPFWWRINPAWAEEIVDEILKLLEKEKIAKTKK